MFKAAYFFQYCNANLVDIKTHSSAVAKRPRDALCLSVVDFNSTKRRAQSFTVSYIDYKFMFIRFDRMYERDR